ncbi:MAG: hypothetical protein ACREGL_07760 [Alphaproteobacteria bacterium]
MADLTGRATVAFGAGALGGLANGLALWLCGRLGAIEALDIALAPELTPAWLYPRIVWGGIWGFLLLLPMLANAWLARGLLLSLAPSAVQLFVVFPLKTSAGVMGLGLGAATPVLVLAANAVWGIVAAAWIRLVR